LLIAVNRVYAYSPNGTPKTMKSHRGTLILVLGILSLVVCGLIGPIAWVMGNNDLREIDTGLMDPAGRSLTNAGRICGMIGTILVLISAVVMILLFGLGFLGAVSSHH
jgi:hypothetical protein